MFVTSSYKKLNINQYVTVRIGLKNSTKVKDWWGGATFNYFIYYYIIKHIFSELIISLFYINSVCNWQINVVEQNAQYLSTLKYKVALSQSIQVSISTSEVYDV